MFDFICDNEIGKDVLVSIALHVALSCLILYNLTVKGKPHPQMHLHNETSSICDVQFVMKCGNFRFLLCPLCSNLPHQLQQSVISQNDFSQLPENVSLQRQPMFPFSPGGARLINCKTIRYIITISSAIFRLLCSLDSFADVAHLQMSQAHPFLCLASFSTIVQQ